MKLFFLTFFVVSLFAQKPDLFLLKNYKEDVNVTSWYMSEKLDGVRAYWDGEKLISRSGRLFSSPAFFTKDFPSHELDGELWTTRDDFSNIVRIVNKKKQHDKWKEITYNIFEVPHATGTLLERLKTVESSHYIKIIKQVQIQNKKHLNTYKKSLQDKGAEGLVVRDGNMHYYTGRTNKAFKIKSFTDTECEVIGHNKGKGKYEGVLGSLSCKMKNMQVIKVGSGLTDKERILPPTIGSIITFKYYGLTSKGNPRFPIFLRVKNEL
ncbi:DNA ligase [Sulfurimonas sp. SAG-AH-194-I05]|nr:DNA ligase [Sulfurimonas sp. SAG-AH-194-I05]MDF1875738.1 DNA ligase [Sulfurimonas sp. SAG-AH-194-I05]